MWTTPDVINQPVHSYRSAAKRDSGLGRRQASVERADQRRFY